ncbi:MAG: aminomethyl-transferring glycine dehydrogenase [Acidobacteria bacterium]|nr:aminomethyl-transferring glycine dehydrogenase [Acidobacteriota bacterium]
MLEAIGAPSVDALFEPVPERVRLQRALDLPPAISEPDLMAHLGALAAQNADATRYAVFLGAGAYRHLAPAFVDQLLLRSEFYTAYTPYQPEISQGTLQAVFEFQTLVCQLLGTDVANASMYDGSTAAAEGATMACRMTKRDRIVVARSLHPHYREVLATYAANLGLEIVEVGYRDDGTLDAAALEAASGGAAALLFQYPNFFGAIEDPRPVVELARRAGAMTVAAVTEPVAMGLLAPPGALGVDIVAAELQAFGVPASFGGPHVGVLAASERCTRQMPGRFVGAAKDTEGRSGYVLTLATREQHIRREKATSNICTNSGLMALAATICMAAYGKQGLPELARLNFDKAHYALAALAQAGVKARFAAPFFNEFVVGGLGDAEAVQRRLLDRHIVAGLPLGAHYPELADALLVCVTEANPVQEIDALADALKG